VTKKGSSFLIIIIVIITLIFVAFMFLRNRQFIPKNINDIKCVSLIAVQGNSMEPSIKSGSTLSLNKCTDKNNLSPNQIVLFEEGGNKRIGRIKQKLEREDGIFYIITRDARPNEEFTVPSGSVLASD
jgi:phage repressor protein C with HTH and peptisase S24 domain